MSMDISGTLELRNDLNRMADMLLGSSDMGPRATKYILQTGAQPILSRMIRNASTDPKRRSGKLARSIKVGKVVRHRRGGYAVTIGVHRSDGGAEYGNPVEFGHGGPHPAPPHPFVRPAFDAASDEAYEKIKELLQQALDARGLI